MPVPLAITINNKVSRTIRTDVWIIFWDNDNIWSPFLSHRCLAFRTSVKLRYSPIWILPLKIDSRELSLFSYFFKWVARWQCIVKVSFDIGSAITSQYRMKKNCCFLLIFRFIILTSTGLLFKSFFPLHFFLLSLFFLS